MKKLNPALLVAYNLGFIGTEHTGYITYFDDVLHYYVIDIYNEGFLINHYNFENYDLYRMCLEDVKNMVSFLC